MRFHRRFFQALFQASRTSWLRPTTRHALLAVECLEDRIVMAASTWTAIGPAPIVGNTSDGGTVTGRVTSIATDPNPNDTTGSTVYIGTAGGGVWEGTNLNSSVPVNWIPLTDNLAAQINDPLVTLSVGAVATVLDPTTNSTVIYAGLGEANAVTNLMTPSEGATQFYGAGIIKSSNGGQSWTLLGGNGTSNLFYGSAFSKIVTVPNHPNLVYAAISTAKNGVMGNEGIWASTDGGQTWTNTTALAGLPANVEYSDLVMDPNTYSSPSNQQVLYAAIGEAAGNLYNGVYMTTNGGQTWQEMTNLPYGSQGGTGTVGRITLALSPTVISGTIDYALYAAFMATKTTPGGNGFGHLNQLGYVEVDGTSSDLTQPWNVIWGSNSGSTVKFLNPANEPFNYVGSQGYYGTSLIVDPNDPSHIYAGGQDNFLDIQNAIGSSSKTPATVLDLADALYEPPGLPGIHVDHHGIAIDQPVANGPFTVLDGSDGGVWQFSPSASRWADLNTNLQISQFYGITANPSDPSQIYGGVQDNGAIRTLGGTTWQAATNGDGGQVFIDPSTSPETVYLTDTAKVYKNTGDAFQPTTPPNLQDVFQNPIPHQPGVPNGYPGNFPAPTYTMQMVNGQGYLWYGGADASNNSVLFLSKDGGNTWNQISFSGQNGWFQMQNTATENGVITDNTVVDSIGVSAANPNLVYVGVRGGQLVVTTDGLAATPTWTNLAPVPITSPSQQVDLRYSAIWVDPNNADIAYVTAANFGSVTGGGHVWMTPNAGQTWTDISGNLPNVPAWSIQVQDGVSGGPTVLYVGTDVGVFESSNGGASWSSYGNGLPNVQVRTMDLFLNPQNSSQDVLLVGTFGRGAFEIVPLLTLSSPGNQANKPGDTVGLPIQSADAVGTETFTAIGLPPGLSINAATGLISGNLSPTSGNTTPYFVIITDTTTSGQVAQVSFNWTVTPAPGIYVVGADAGGLPLVRVYDAQTDVLKFFFFAYDPSFTGGVRVATGDVTGDGVPDIITGPGPGMLPEIKVFDGVSGVKVRDFFAGFDPRVNPLLTGGVFAAAGDVNGDGYADIIVGTGAGAVPEVAVFSGKDYGLPCDNKMFDFIPFDPAFHGGVHVGAGDVTGAGHADIIVGAGPGGAAEVKVFDGVGGALLLDFFAYDPGFQGGVWVAGGDVTGAGLADIITGAGTTPLVKVFSGNETVLDNFFAFNPAFIGGVRVAATDVTGDGRADLVLGAGPFVGPEVRILDALSLTELDAFFAFDPAFRGGVFVAGV